MNTYEWLDITIYSQSETEREPSVWEVSHDGLQIVVTNGHLHDPGKWFVSCREVGFDARSLSLKNTASAEEAQKTAVAFVKARLAHLLRAATEIENPPSSHK